MYQQNLIAFVNSGSMCFAELVLNRHTLIKATGNTGKSSILNALKLFWLPEVNFMNAESKFKFVNKQSEAGFYSGEETYSYYFPSSDTSYIILESENTHGKFCQILYPRTRMGYGRIFAHCSFDEISKLFWNKESNDTLGVGEPNDSLDKEKILSHLKSENIKFKNVTSKEELESLLYNDSIIEDGSEFALFPLKSRTTQSIKTFETIVHLMCGFKASNRELSDLFASTIEGMKKEDADKLNLDIAHILKEKSDFDTEESALANLDNFSDTANKIAALSNYLRQAPENNGQAFKSIKAQLEKNLESQEAQSITLTEEASELNQSYKDICSESLSLRDKKTSTEAKLAISSDSLNEAEQVVNRAEEVLQEYPKDFPISGSDDSVIGWLKADIEETKEKISTYVDGKKTEARIKELKKKISKNQVAIENLSGFNSDHSPLHREITMEQCQKLASVNELLLDINTNSINEEAKNNLIGFINSLSVNDNAISIADISIPLAKYISLEDRNQDLIQDLKNELSDLEVEMNELLAYLESDSKTQRTTRNNLQKSIKQTDSDIRFLMRYELIKENIEGIREENSKLTSILEQVSNDIEVCKAKTEEIKLSYEDKTQVLSLIKQDIQKTKDMLSRLNQAANTPVFSVLLERTKEPNSVLASEVTNDQIDEVAKSMAEYSQCTSELKRLLTTLVVEGIISDAAKAVYEEGATYYSLEPLALNTKGVFDEIENRKAQLIESRKSHHAMLALKLNELQGNSDLIKVFEANVNRDYQSLKINNLTGVKIKIVVDEQFEQLLSESTELKSDKASNEFYERLAAFADHFFGKSGSGELTLSKVIKQIKFETKKENTDWIETGQSNSTVTLISIVLLQKMFKEILNPESNANIPLTIDEIAHIDEGEIYWLTKSLEETGYSLIAASTNNVSVYTLDALGSESCIDLCKAVKSYSPSRLNVFYGYEGVVCE